MQYYTQGPEPIHRSAAGKGATVQDMQKRELMYLEEKSMLYKIKRINTCFTQSFFFFFFWGGGVKNKVGISLSM